jgi:nicotinamidase-related amidase
MTQALIVVDAQNEFSAEGKRPVPNHTSALAAILDHVDRARGERRPIAWVRHHNKPSESPAFIPQSWGADFSPGLGPRPGFGPEALFEKDVFGAFTGTGLDTWLRSVGADAVLIVGQRRHGEHRRHRQPPGDRGAVPPGATLVPRGRMRNATLAILSSLALSNDV